MINPLHTVNYAFRAPGVSVRAAEHYTLWTGPEEVHSAYRYRLGWKYGKTISFIERVTNSTARKIIYFWKGP